MLVLQLANFLAKYSCLKWNGSRATSQISRNLHRATRVACRHALWSVADLDARLHPRHEQLGFLIDTYPRVYLYVGQWEETNDALVVDRSKLVCRHSTSYCARKYYEVTGAWPTAKVIPRDDAHAAEIAKRERPHDAKHWVEFLSAQKHFRGLAPRTYTGYHYIGIRPDYGEYGLVVWFERNVVPEIATQEPTEAWVTSYIDQHFWGDKVKISDFTWVEIG